MITQENIPYTADELKAMVKTIEELRKKYNAALERARALNDEKDVDVESSTTICEYIFPELKEDNNEEKIRKEIVDFITSSNKYGTNERCEAWLNWLEKQGKKPQGKSVLEAIKEEKVDKVEQKFREGDYIVPYNVTPLEIWKVINIDEDGYYNIESITDPEDDGIYHVPGFILEENYYLWSINDTNDGDVLVDEDNNIGLYSGEKDDVDWHSYIYLGCDGCLRGGGGYHKRKNTKPATKEQRELLFTKMKEAGYEWKQGEKDPCIGCTNDKGCVTCENGNLKEIKIEQKFKVGDWIVTDDSFGKIVRHVDEISSNIIDERYGVSDEYGLTYNISFDKEHKWHKWTIQDASNGDVLVNGSNIFIFRFINHTRLMGYCHVNINDGRFYDDLGKNECFCTIDAVVTPATKEQRDLLFSKMKQEGYEWDDEKKKLSKQTLKIMPKFCVDQRITDNNGTWYRITNIKCLDDWYYEVYDALEDNTHLELCSIIDEKFR